MGGDKNHQKGSNHENFITKINIHVIFGNFTKILNHENLELYSMYLANSCALYELQEPKAQEKKSPFKNYCPFMSSLNVLIGELINSMCLLSMESVKPSHN